jgi:very-short-patch-repair endonuclease
MKKGYRFTKEAKLKMSKAKLGDKNPAKREEVRLKLRASRLGKCHSEETKKKMSEAKKREWALGLREIPKNFGVPKGQKPDNWETLYTPEINEKRRIARLKQKLPTIDTSIEIKVEEWLNENQIEYIHPFNLGNRFQCDFYLPTVNLIVECDGEYWHSREDMKKRDKAKDCYAKKCGYEILRLPEREITNGQFCDVLLGHLASS